MVHEIWESESTCSKACDILRLCELLMSSRSDHKFCQAPCSLVTTVACDNRNGRGLLSFGMQGFDRLVSRNQWNCRSFRCEPIADHVAGQFQLRQTKNVNTTDTFRPYSYRAWILEGFFLHFLPEKYTHESESPPVYVEPFMRSPSWNIFECQI